MTYKELAQRIMFGSGINILPEAIASFGFAYRKGKTPDDLKSAVQKGLQAGAGKVEREEFEIALRVERVLKICLPAKKESAC